MLRFLSCLILLSACSMGTIKSGGEEGYVYDVQSEYTSENIKTMAPQVVMSSSREPRVGKLKDLFGPKQRPLKRIGIVIFETTIEPTRGGLAGQDKIYLSEQGKQLLTEKMLKIWEQSLPILAPGFDYVTTHQVRKSKSFHEYGFQVDDYIKSKRSSLAPDDIFFLEPGKKTPTVTVLNPRHMRDLSFALVPAYELMGGPKWSEHNKQFLNDVVKDLKLDAAIIVMSEASWTAAHSDKRSGEVFPEEIKIKISASTLLPLHLYHERLEKLGNHEKVDVTLCYRAYEGEIKVPALISLPLADQNFDRIEQELLNPLLKAYKDLTQMSIVRMTDDLKKTW